MKNLKAYNSEYYSVRRMGWKEVVYKHLAEGIVRPFNPKSMIDIGCGNGVIKNGFSGVYKGIDGSSESGRICREKGIDFTLHDLSEQGSFGTYDLAVSIEVAEHIEEKCANNFVHSLCNSSDNIVITASNTAGPTHVNCQPKEYWIRKFYACGFQYDEYTTNSIVNELKKVINKPYDYLYSNLMVFRKLIKK